MMSTSPVKVRLAKDLTHAEMNEVVRVWAAAFRDDDFTRAVTGGDAVFYEKFIYSTLLAASKGGEVYLASLEDTPVAGAAAWYPPGHALLDTPEQGQGGFNDLFAAFTPELRTWWMEYFLPKYEANTTRVLGEGVKLNSWHLQFIGVKPELQSRGVGSALVDFVSQKAASRGGSLCAEIENEANLVFYEKHGMYLKAPPEDYENVTKDFKMWIVVKDN